MTADDATETRDRDEAATVAARLTAQGQPEEAAILARLNPYELHQLARLERGTPHTRKVA